MKKNYLNVWNPNFHKTFSDPREKLIAHGILAPSGHNMQPWSIKLDQNNHKVMYLYIEKDRLTPKVDPIFRQLMISQGTFLEYMKIAGETLGYELKIDLFPFGIIEEKNFIADISKKPIARIELIEISPIKNTFYDMLFLPDTNRLAYQKREIQMDAILQLNDMIKDEYITSSFYNDEKNVKEISHIAYQSVRIEADQKDVMKETDAVFRSNEKKKNHYKYGFSLEGQGMKGPMKYLIQGMITLFPKMGQGEGSKKAFLDGAIHAIENTSNYFMLSSNDNDYHSQIKAGMTYARLVLKAHELGLAVQPLSQAIQEYDEMKTLYDQIHQLYGEHKTIQMLARIGYPKEKTELSMRMLPHDIIKKNE